MSAENQPVEDLIESAFEGEGGETTQRIRGLVREINGRTRQKLNQYDTDGSGSRIQVALIGPEGNISKLFSLTESETIDQKPRCELEVVTYPGGVHHASSYIYDWDKGDSDTPVKFYTDLPDQNMPTTEQMPQSMATELQEMLSYSQAPVGDPHVASELVPLSELRNQ
jgi:hypothetical protein